MFYHLNDARDSLGSLEEGDLGWDSVTGGFLQTLSFNYFYRYTQIVGFPSLSPFNPHTDVRCMGLWLECFPYLQGCLQVSEKYLVAGITLNQLKGRQMVIYMVWMVEYRR